MKKEQIKKNYILKKGITKAILYLLCFNINIMLYNFNSYDLLIDIILLIINILLFIFIYRSILYYRINIYLFKKYIKF